MENTYPNTSDVMDLLRLDLPVTSHSKADDET